MALDMRLDMVKSAVSTEMMSPGSRGRLLVIRAPPSVLTTQCLERERLTSCRVSLSIPTLRLQCRAVFSAGSSQPPCHGVVWLGPDFSAQTADPICGSLYLSPRAVARVSVGR